MNFRILTVCAFTVAVVGCGGKKGAETNTARDDDTVAVETITVTATDFVQRGEYYGEVSGLREAYLVNVSGGTVEQINARIGSWVKEGQSLAKIDAARAAAQLETAKLQEKVAKDNYERTKAFYEQGTSSQVALDNAHLAWLQAKTQRLQAQKAYNGAYCITPIAGRVASRSIDEFQEIGPGTPTFVVAQIHKVKIVVSVPESEIAGVSVGNEATITFAAVPGRTWEGKVQSVSQKANPATKRYEVELLVENKEGVILPGMTAQVNLTLGTMTDQVVIPTSAVLTVGSRNEVMTVSGETVERRPVELGPMDEERTLVTEGLEPGDQLIIAGQQLVTNGDPVIVKKRGE